MLGRMGNFYCWEGWGISTAGKNWEFLLLGRMGNFLAGKDREFLMLGRMGNF